MTARLILGILEAGNTKGHEMSTGKSDLTDVSLEPRMVRGKAQAFFQGELDENDREVWIWLPLSQIEVSEKDDKGLVVVTMPEWLALDKGLI